MENLIILSGTSNPELSREISQNLGVNLAEISITRFADGEINVKVLTNVRGKDVFLIQSTCPPVNDNLMELLIVIDALRRASAKRITAVIPYYGYARQDRKVEPRVPITAKLVANLLVAAGANRVLSLELHAGQIQGFFDIPVDNLYSSVIFVEKFKTIKLEEPVVVSPDAGGVDRARALAKHLNADLALVDKRRPAPNKAKVFNIIGEVEGKNCLIYDDIVDTAGTATEVAKALEKNGAKRIFLLATHPVLSGDAQEKIENSPLEKVIVTNSIKLFASAIERIHHETSISDLFKL